MVWGLAALISISKILRHPWSMPKNFDFTEHHMWSMELSEKMFALTDTHQKQYGEWNDAFLEPVPILLVRCMEWDQLVQRFEDLDKKYR